MPNAFQVDERDGGIALVTFDVPDKKVNTLSQGVLRELAGLVGQLEQRTDLRGLLLRSAKPGHFYNVITHGYGAMYSYNERVSSDDRWRITAYIRALQASNPNDHGLTTTPPAQQR